MSQSTDTIDPLPVGSVRWASLAWLFPAVVLLAHLPLLLDHFQILWRRPHYQYFPAVFVAVAALVATRLQRLPFESQNSRLRLMAGLLLTVSLLSLIGAIFLSSPWLGSVSFVVACGAVLLQLTERYYLQNALGIWCLLWLTVRLPFSYDIWLSQWLQQVTTRVSGSVLDQMGIVNLVEGITITTRTQRLFVEDACSGIVSLMAVVACSLIIAVWMNRGLLHTLLLIAAGVGWAGVTNATRIIIAAVAGERFNTDLSTGTVHDALGLVCFGLTLLLTLSSDRLLELLLGPFRSTESRGSEQEFDATPQPRLVRLWDVVMTCGEPIDAEEIRRRGQKRSAHYPVRHNLLLPVWAVLFIGVGAASVLFASATSGSQTTGLPSSIAALNRGSLPAQIRDWRLTGFKDTHDSRIDAEYARTWTYVAHDLTASFTVAFSYDRWHELCECYTAVGWNQIAIARNMTPDRSGSAFVEAGFSRDTRDSALLLYSMFHSTGEPLAPPATALDYLRERIRRPGGDLQMMQLWVLSQEPLAESEKGAAKRLFETLRELTTQQVFPGRPRPNVREVANGSL